MVFWRRMRVLREDEQFREKMVEMATEFCLEAAVLISVLGTLEAAIAWKGIPPFRDFLYSGLIGGSFLAIACIIQVREALRRSAKEGEL